MQDQALWIHILKFSLKMGTYLLRGFFLKVLDENPKIVLPAVILKKKFLTPNFTKFLNPKGNFSALFYLYSNLIWGPPYNILKFHKNQRPKICSCSLRSTLRNTLLSTLRTKMRNKKDLNEYQKNVVFLLKKSRNQGRGFFF